MAAVFMPKLLTKNGLKVRKPPQGGREGFFMGYTMRVFIGYISQIVAELRLCEILSPTSMTFIRR